MASKNDKGDKRGPSYSQLSEGTRRSEPILHQNAREIQPYGKIANLPIALDEKVCAKSAENLNQLLADTMTLRDMYKKHHWQVAGHTFYQLHLLFDKHHGEQDELVDEIAGGEIGFERFRFVADGATFMGRSEDSNVE